MMKSISKINIFFIISIIIALSSQLNFVKNTEKIIEDISYQSPNIINNKLVKVFQHPIKFNDVRNLVTTNKLNINFVFSSADSGFSYGNIFQTGNTNNAIRLELQPKSSLAILLGDHNQHIIRNNLIANKFYQIEIDYDVKKHLKVFVDKKLELEIYDQNLLNNAHDYDNFYVATGFNKKRNFNGTIKNFKAKINYEELSGLSIAIKFLVFLLCVIFFTIFNYNKTSAHHKSYNISNNDCDSENEQFITQIALFGFILFFIVLGLLFTKLTNYIEFGFLKWFSYIGVPVSSILFIYIYKVKKIIWEKIYIIISFLSFLYFVSLIYSYFSSYDYIISYALVILFSFFFYIYLLYRDNIDLSFGLKKFYLPNFMIMLVILVCWCSFINLPNFNSFYINLQASNIFLAGPTVLGIFIISNFVINHTNLEVSPVVNNNYLKYINIIFYIFVIYSFLFLSFRHDTIFIPGAEYHWSYFTGVLQGINNAGWLLWDTPSQYGFLNIIIASLFKSSSSWQSFYLFQGSLLFLVSTTIFFTLVKKMNLSFIYKILFFLIITLALYFADPAYIGPYPFPSSSVVRFFGIYAFIIVSLYFTVFSIRQAVSFSIVWIIAFLWSAESALYVSSIYIFVLTAYLIRKNSFSNFSSIYKYYLVLPLFFLFIGILFISTYYRLNIGVYPDYLLFIEHAIGYAGGHGYVPFDLYGPGNILLLLYVGIFYIFLQHPLNNKKNNEYFSTIIIMLASIWAIGSYYVGRPVPQNITAVIPILLLIILISNYIIDFKSFKYNHLSKIISVCFVFIILTPILNTQLYETLKNIDSGEINIQDNIYESSKDIENLFLEIDIEEYDKLVFYGDSATQPIFSGDLSKFNNTNWLPIPLQLLENPIAEERKVVLIDRYLCRNKTSRGLLLADVSSAILPRLNKFLINFSSYYTIKLVSVNNGLRLYSFNNFTNINCKNNFN